MNKNKLQFDLIPFIVNKSFNRTRHEVKYNIAAVGYDKNGNYLGSAMNYHSNFINDFKGRGRHAERELIKHYGKAIDTIYLCRTGMTGEIRPIEPCPVCSKIARKMGIKIIPIHEILEKIKGDIEND